MERLFRLHILSAPYTLERPMYWCQHGIYNSADRGIVPDVPELRPLHLRIHAHYPLLNRHFHSEVRCQRCERVLPEFILRFRSPQAEANFIDRVTGAHKQLNLCYCAAILFIGAKGNPARKHVTLRVHECEGFVIGIEYKYSRGNRQANRHITWYQHIDERHFTRGNPGLWRVEAIPLEPER